MTNKIQKGENSILSVYQSVDLSNVMAYDLWPMINKLDVCNKVIKLHTIIARDFVFVYMKSRTIALSHCFPLLHFDTQQRLRR